MAQGLKEEWREWVVSDVRGDGLGARQPESSAGDADRHQAQFQLYGKQNDVKGDLAAASSDRELVICRSDPARGC